MARVGRNPVLSSKGHLGALGKNALQKKKGYYGKRMQKAAAQPKPEAQPEDLTATIKKPVGGTANGKERVIPVNKAPRFYSADDVAVPKKSRKTGTQTPTLRKSITPGTVLILLAGAKKGSRVVCLKQLPKSGLLLVTGPYKINGIGLKRVNPAYVIATSTKVDISNLKLDEKVNDDLFKRPSSSKKSGEAAFFKDTKPEELSDAQKAFKAERASLQKSTDAAVLESVSKVPNLSKYLAASFSLSNGEKPHLMKF